MNEEKKDIESEIRRIIQKYFVLSPLSSPKQYRLAAKEIMVLFYTQLPESSPHRGIKLKDRHKKSWLKALRSGEYEQTFSGDVMDQEGRCSAVGVGIDVLQDAYWVASSHGQGFDLDAVETEKLTYKMILSEWFEKDPLTTTMEFMDEIGDFIDLIGEMNDDWQFDFSVIARHIEIHC